MSKNKIPKAKYNVIKNSIKKPIVNSSRNSISFSFEILEFTEYFNLDSTCEKWVLELFNMLKKISVYEKMDFINGKLNNSTFRVHTHENANPPSELPDGVELKDCYQIRISKSKGGIHGIFTNDIFYVIWLDPFHNMYPDERFGGLKKIASSKNCCMERDEIIEQQANEIRKLREENEILNGLLECIDS